MSSITVEFYISFAIGLIVLLTFSWDQLNRPLTSGRVSNRRERLLRTLLPNQLARTAVYFKGYLVYAALLCAIYTFVCFWGGPTAGILVGKPSIEGNPALPLFVSLAFVGITPATGFFKTTESRIRSIAYRTAGIPEAFNEYTDHLVSERITEDDIPDELLSNTDAKEIDRITTVAKTAFDSAEKSETFKQSIIRIVAFRAWAEAHRIWPGRRVTEKFSPLVNQITENVHDLMGDLKDQADLPLDVQQPSRWEKLRQRSASTAEDICALFAVISSKAGSQPTDDTPVSHLLRAIFRDADLRRTKRDERIDLLIITYLLIAVISFTYSLFIIKNGIFKLEEGNLFNEAANQMMAVCFLLIPSFIVSASIKRMFGDSWRNPFEGGSAVFPISQFLMLIVPTLFVATLVQFANQTQKWLREHSKARATDSSECSNPSELFDCLLGQIPAADPSVYALFGIASVLFALTLLLTEDMRSKSVLTRSLIHGGSAVTIAIIVYLATRSQFPLGDGEQYSDAIPLGNLPFPDVRRDIFLSYDSLKWLLISLVVFWHFDAGIQRINRENA